MNLLSKILRVNALRLLDRDGIILHDDITDNYLGFFSSFEMVRAQNLSILSEVKIARSFYEKQPTVIWC